MSRTYSSSSFINMGLYAIWLFSINTGLYALWLFYKYESVCYVTLLLIWIWLLLFYKHESACYLSPINCIFGSVCYLFLLWIWSGLLLFYKHESACYISPIYCIFGSERQNSFILAQICKYMLLISFYNKGQHVTTLLYKYGYKCYLSLL